MGRYHLTWYEFFAGGGMARLGLGDGWKCLFANEWSATKARSYAARFGPQQLRVCDVARLTPDDLPGSPDLVWASFPCQDLSLAGNGAGLNGHRSGTFHPFWELVRGLIQDGRAPSVIVLENVIGALTSHQGNDFAFLMNALVGEGYRAGALVIDAVRFLPQSRPRLFIIGARQKTLISAGLTQSGPSDPWHTRSLVAAVDRLPDALKNEWLWWNLPLPHAPVPPFSALLEAEPAGVDWHTPAETDHIVGLMSPVHREKLRSAQRHGRKMVGTLYRRTRPNGNGGGVRQRAEVRFDEVAGCLRTPAGGSSRQTVIIVEGPCIRSRLLSPREAARLMGLPDDYPVPENYNAAYHLFGDGLAVPVVRWLSCHLLVPVAAGTK